MANHSLTDRAYCPHCGLAVEKPDGYERWPQHPMRCPHCRLLIGAGRTRPEPHGDPGTRGAAAGVLSREARRDEQAGGNPDVVSEQAVLEAIREIAHELGTRPERLLMVDYQQASDNDPRLPPLRAVFAHFKSWKRARRVAGDGARRDDARREDPRREDG